jgi:hypothetical protein
VNPPPQPNPPDVPVQAADVQAADAQAHARHRRGRGAAGMRLPLGGFVNRERTEIRTPAHAAALKALMQVASGYPDGIGAAMGIVNRSRWVRTNIDALFAAGGPLEGYNSIGWKQLCIHLRNAMACAKLVYDRDHSNDQSGAQGESIPSWMFWFHKVLEYEEGLETNAALMERNRSHNRSINSSIAGRQARLGYRGDSPEEERTETTRNVRSTGLRQQVIGDVSSERVRDRRDLVEGEDDTANSEPAPTRGAGRPRRTVHRRNAMIDDPSSRFHRVASGHEALAGFTEAVSGILNTPPTPSTPPVAEPTRREIVVAREYSEMMSLLNATSDPEAQAFYRVGLRGLMREMTQLARHNSNHEGKTEES